jgi:hypothetical protein
VATFRLMPLPARESGVLGDGLIKINEQCATCRHWRAGVTCDAFPEGIPPAIWRDGVDHTVPFPGDGGTLYELDTSLDVL